MTPQKAYKNEDYQKAALLASKRIQNNFKVETNLGIYKKANLKLINKRLKELSHLNQSKNISELEVVHEDNAKLLLSSQVYEKFTFPQLEKAIDKLKAEQNNIEREIATLHFESGQKAMDLYHKSFLKKDARDAYQHFATCQRYNGQIWFDDIEFYMEKAYAQGVVYYTSKEAIPPSMFLEKIPEDSPLETDCELHVEKGRVAFGSRRKSKRRRHTKRIATGTQTVRDTSGRVTGRYTTYTNVAATLIKTTVTLTASSNNWIVANNISGQCHLDTHEFKKAVSDKYYEYEIRGDRRALRFPQHEYSGEPQFLRDKLEEQLDEEISTYTTSR